MDIGELLAPIFPAAGVCFDTTARGGREGGRSPRRNRGERKPIVTGSPIKLIGGALAVPFVHCSYLEFEAGGSVFCETFYLFVSKENIDRANRKWYHR